MFDNVVVGIDNYEAGRDALECRFRRDQLLGQYRLRDRFSGGSTSQRLADSAACPLLVLGPGTRDAARAR